MDLGRFLIDYQNNDLRDNMDTNLLNDVDHFKGQSEIQPLSTSSQLGSDLLFRLKDFGTFTFDSVDATNGSNGNTPNEQTDNDVKAPLSKSQRVFDLSLNRPYAFPLAARIKSNSLFKIALNHTVAGLYIGKHGANLKRLQSRLNFKLTQSGRGTRGGFTGVGFPCHRTNTALLFEGTLADILVALRPLYRIIQNEVLTLDKESQRFVSGRVLNVKFELDIILPLDRKKLLMQEEGIRCNRLRRISGVGIIAGKQNYEWGNIKETIVTLHGFEENVERACEWLGVFLQDSPAVYSRDFTFIDYPKYTLAVPEGLFN
ncbi:hypothetical protein BaOVIS_015070 [Babesia ovis]|uniref:K Homology domain-containing protein n=1 Tax=Babesia ovis TaxID=5869 RepID=A0A9W5WUP0_BABOV|nr:hypothetical protein BaOVIS_015070 [Babesia ovis]